MFLLMAHRVTSMRCGVGRYRSIADSGQAVRPADLWVHGLVSRGTAHLRESRRCATIKPLWTLRLLSRSSFDTQRMEIDAAKLDAAPHWAATSAPPPDSFEMLMPLK